MQIRTNFQVLAHSGYTQAMWPSTTLQSPANLHSQSRSQFGSQKATDLHHLASTSQLQQTVPIVPRLDAHRMASKLTPPDLTCHLLLYHQRPCSQSDALPIGRMARVDQKSRGHRHQLDGRKWQHQRRSHEPEETGHQQRQHCQRHKHATQLPGRHRTIAPQQPLHTIFRHGGQPNGFEHLSHSASPQAATTYPQAEAAGQGQSPAI